MIDSRCHFQENLNIKSMSRWIRLIVILLPVEEDEDRRRRIMGTVTG